jgi:hypothetical protein
MECLSTTPRQAEDRPAQVFVDISENRASVLIRETGENADGSCK